MGLDAAAVSRSYLAGLLHDIGKLTLPEGLLQKPGPLDLGEWDDVRERSSVGAQLVARMTAVRDAAPIVAAHHERWDGTGYPSGLAGYEIPAEARIVAVADALVSMTSDRPYRPRARRPAPSRPSGAIRRSAMTRPSSAPSSRSHAKAACRAARPRRPRQSRPPSGRERRPRPLRRVWRNVARRRGRDGRCWARTQGGRVAGGYGGRLRTRHRAVQRGPGGSGGVSPVPLISRSSAAGGRLARAGSPRRSRTLRRSGAGPSPPRGRRARRTLRGRAGGLRRARPAPRRRGRSP